MVTAILFISGYEVVKLAAADREGRQHLFILWFLTPGHQLSCSLTKQSVQYTENYNDEVSNLITWCQENNLSLNVDKMKEPTTKYRKQTTDTLVQIHST